MTNYEAYMAGLIPDTDPNIARLIKEGKLTPREKRSIESAMPVAQAPERKRLWERKPVDTGRISYTKQTNAPIETEQAMRGLAEVPKGIMEAGLATGSAIAAAPVAGLRGMYELAKTGDPAQATRAIEDTSQAMTYEPRTKTGRGLAQAANLPIEMYNKAAAGMGEAGEEEYGIPREVTTGFLQAAPVVLGGLKSAFPKEYSAGMNRLAQASVAPFERTVSGAVSEAYEKSSPKVKKVLEMQYPDITSNLENSQGQKITQPENFKGWFGDSKAVNEQGKPLVVYHGSPKGGFTEFKPEFQGMTGGRSRGGYSFTTNRNAAEGYSTAYSDESVALDQGIKLANDAMRIVDKTPEALKVLQDADIANADVAPEFYWGAIDDNQEFADYLRELADMVKPHSKEAYNKLIAGAEAIDNTEVNPQVYEVYLKVPHNAPEFTATPATLGEVVAGLDVRNVPGRAAVVNMPNGEQVFYIADPENIKSVYNRGTFDPKNPNILKGIGAGAVGLGAYELSDKGE